LIVLCLDQKLFKMDEKPLSKRSEVMKCLKLYFYKNLLNCVPEGCS
jgi:hypothetical protein